MVGGPVGDFELLLCHGTVCVVGKMRDLILQLSKSSIYSTKPPEDYKQYLTHEGEYKPEARAWQSANNTYGFSNGLGVVEVIIALLVLANPVNRWLGLLGGLMAFTTPLVTLSFLITTPEAWVPALGDAHHGFPYLSGAGRLVLKDTLMLAGAVMIMADSAREILKQRSNESSSTLKTEY
ncbi:DUF417 family protein [Escherichia coli]|uniref:DUF417 family protein n=1 Tax=Escherichia coli TaxID=562 RepID=UPI003FCE0BE9